MLLRDGLGPPSPAGTGRLTGRVSADHECPVCVTRRRRLEPAGAAPAVWYDTLLHDWVTRPPRAAGVDVLVPLEIGCFDAGFAEVYRAAGDILFAADAIAEAANDDRPAIDPDC